MTGLPDIYGKNSSQTPNYARYDVEFVRGEGAYLYDGDGNQYLDLLCGIGVNSVGHCHPKVVAAIREQAGTLIHTSNLFWTHPAERLARSLVEKSFGSRVFFCNSGAEAIEAALKVARAHAFAAGKGGRDVVVLESAFHGRTMGALSATPQEDKQAPFAPLVGGFRTVANNDAQAMADAITDQTCAVLLEPVQGEGGVFRVPDDVLVAAREGCDAVGALLIFDEIQTGMGRTGSFFAYQQTPVVPDVMTLAKALGGGLPIGALVAGESNAEVLQPGYHGSTFGGNLVAAAAANAVLEVIEDEALVENARETGEFFAAELEQFGIVHGRGLMIGLEIDSAFDAREVVKLLLFDHHVIANATGAHMLRFLPPLAIDESQVAVAVTALSAVLNIA